MQPHRHPDAQDSRLRDDDTYRPAPQTLLGFALYVICVLAVLAACIAAMEGKLGFAPFKG